jgi:hypothetical protein
MSDAGPDMSRAALREVNARIQEAARRYYGFGEAAEFLCECSQPRASLRASRFF